MKKFSLKLFLLFIGLVSCQCLFSQKNNLPGYIVNHELDTVHGFIDYRNWEKNPDKIVFKNVLDGDPAVYKPNDINSFGVKDEIYVSAIIQRETSPVKTSELNANREIKLESDTAFLQTIISGHKSLFYLKDRDGKDQIYIWRENSYDLLIYKRFLKNVKGSDVTAEINTYIGQMTLYLEECPSITTKLENTKYAIASIENLFLYYYECTDSKWDFHKKSEKVTADIGLLAGMTLTKIKFNGDIYPYLVNTDFSSSTYFAIGFFFDVKLPRNLNKLSICNEIMLTSYKTNAQYSDIKNEEDYTIYRTSLGYTYLNANILFRYKLPINKAYLFANAGLSNGFAVTETNNLEKEIKFYTMDRQETGPAIDDTRKYELGLLAGLGAIYKRFYLEARYEVSNGMSSIIGLASPKNQLLILAGFRF